jgi:hypothetical protein
MERAVGRLDQEQALTLGGDQALDDFLGQDHSKGVAKLIRYRSILRVPVK